MYIFKNALVSINRNKGRNILIGIIIVVIAAASAIALSIKNASTTLVKAYEEKYNIEATLSLDRESVMSNLTKEDSQEEKIESFNSIKSATIDEINDYGDSEYVDYYYYTWTVGMDSSTLEEATDTIQKNTTKETKTTKSFTKNFESGGGPGGMPFGGQTSSKVTTNTKTTTEFINPNAVDGAFSLVGYSSYEGMSDFVNGDYVITEGYIDEDFSNYSCVVNSELAELNDIKVGNTIKLQNPDSSKLSYELTVTGIYEDSTESTEMMSMYTNSVNNIITNTNVIEKILEDDEDLSTVVTPTFVLKDKEDFENFSLEVEEKGLSEYYTVTSNIGSIESETESIKNVSLFATTFLIITLVIGGIVLLVINMINLRERKYEIGVLRTIGMKKILVICQFTFELLVVALIGILLGTAIGATSSVKIANKLLENEILSSQEQKMQIDKNFGERENSVEEISVSNESKSEITIEKSNISSKINGVVEINEFDSIDAVVDLKVLFQLLLIGIGLTLVGSLASIISIASFSPLTILKERS